MTRSLLLFMPFVGYIIYSPSLYQYYIGQFEKPEDRLFRHNNSGRKSTKKANDRKPVYSGTFQTKSGATKRELAIKKKKSHKYIEWLINSPDSSRDGCSVQQDCGKVIPGAFGIISTSPDNVKSLSSCPVFCWLKPLLLRWQRLPLAVY